MTCEDARNYVRQKLSESGMLDSVDTEQIEELTAACCHDITSQACNEAIGKVATTAVCVAYTEGACIPCCKIAGNIIGPVLAKGVALVVSIGKALWDAISSLFGGGSCDFDPAYNDIRAKLVDAFHQLAAHLATAWADARAAVGLGRDESTNASVNKIPGYSPYQQPGNTLANAAWVVKALDGRLVIMTGEEAALRIRYLSGEPDLDIPLIAGVDYPFPSGFASILHPTGGSAIVKAVQNAPNPKDVDVVMPFLEPWESILIWTSAWYANKSYPWFRWTVSGDDNAEMMLPKLPVAWPATGKAELYYAAWWKGWDCKNGEQWASSMQDIMNKRQNSVLEAAHYLGESMAQAFVRENVARQVTEAAAAAAQGEQKSVSTTAWILGLAVAGFVGFGGWAAYQDYKLRQLTG